jgi:hypothetical protein
MAPRFEQKSHLNPRLLEALSLRCKGKPSDILPWPSQMYYRNHTADDSLIGSVGHLPDSTYAGFQAPNSMGIVLLVTPDQEGNVVVKCFRPPPFEHSNISVLPHSAAVHRCAYAAAERCNNQSYIP